MTQTSRVMNGKQLFCYGFLTAPLALAGFALVFFIPTYYAVEVGLGLGVVGVVFAVGRVLDVVSDPLVGYLSDQTRHRWGARLPWMVWGAPGLVLAVWMLLVPPEGAGLTYLIVASGAFYLLYTIVDVPYSSVGLEISPDENERSTLAGTKAAFQVGGAILASLVPVVLASQMGLSLQAIGLCVLILTVIGLALFWRFVPRTDRQVTLPRIGVVAGYRFVLRHPRFRHLVTVFFVVQAANALTAGLIVLHASHVIGAPQMVGPFFLTIFVSTALFLPVWIWLSKWKSKPVSWACAIVLCCLALGLAVTLGQGDVVAMLVVCALIGASFGSDAMMPTSMLADLVYEGEEAGDHRRAGSYLAIKNAVSKLTFIVPMAVAFPVLDLVGFNKAGANDGTALGVLVVFFAGVPIALRLLALGLLLFAAPRVDRSTVASGAAE